MWRNYTLYTQKRNNEPDFVFSFIYYSILGTSTVLVVDYLVSSVPWEEETLEVIPVIIYTIIIFVWCTPQRPRTSRCSPYQDSQRYPRELLPCLSIHLPYLRIPLLLLILPSSAALNYYHNSGTIIH